MTDVRAALLHSLTRWVTDELLDVIFRDFCIGK